MQLADQAQPAYSRAKSPPNKKAIDSKSMAFAFYLFIYLSIYVEHSI